jgi:ribosomal-protein-alanine N-acetyltransferase
MNLGDISAVVAIENQSFSLPWSRESFRREIERIPNSRLIVAEGDGGEEKGGNQSILGYACWWEVADECHITNIAVRPTARRRGVGVLLLEGILDAAKRAGLVRATLEVRTGKTAAIAFYEKKGFTAAAIRPRYFPDNGEDALVMWKAKI